MPRLLALLLALGALAVPASALGASAPKQGSEPPAARGTLVQMGGARGCLVDRSTPTKGCGSVRALKDPAPLLGSRAVALSPDGKNLYVASSESNAIAIFRRDAKTGALTQARGAAGCIASGGASGCASAVGLGGANSVAVSPDGRSVYATAEGGESVTTFARNPNGGGLTQLPVAGGCISSFPLPGCSAGRALVGPDVVTVSPDGRNVYVGSFFGNSVAVFDRDPTSGMLSQPGDSSGCIATATSGCATGLALGSIEGMAISPDGRNVYLGAAVSEAVDVLARNPTTGALTQASNGSGCIVSTPLAGCTTGAQLDGADAVALSPNGRDVYVASLFSKSVTSFTRSTASGALTQGSGPAGCLVFLRSTGCSFGRAIATPEGVAVSPDGTNVYVGSYAPGTIAVLDRSKRSGTLKQKPLKAGCAGSVPDCAAARGLSGVGSLVVSSDGRFVYSAASTANAVDVFRRASGR